VMQPYTYRVYISEIVSIRTVMLNLTKVEMDMKKKNYSLIKCKRSNEKLIIIDSGNKNDITDEQQEIQEHDGNGRTDIEYSEYDYARKQGMRRNK